MFFALLFALHQPLCGLLCGADAFAHYSRLLARAGFFEEAAFLVRDDYGHIRAIDWHSSKRRTASFHGRIPDQCIGIAHTHPQGDKEPSPEDRAEARRIQLPIVVVTSQAITVAWPDGSMAYLADHTGW
jgi:Prokaryotic homologs of the JAB domain